MAALAAALLAAALVVSGCAGDPESTEQSPARTGDLDDSATDTEKDDRYARLDGLDDLNFGQDWTNDADGGGLNDVNLHATAQPRNEHDGGGLNDLNRGGSGGSNAGPAPTSSNDHGPATGTWTVVLKTFSHDSHANAAATMLGELPKINANLTRKAHVVTNEQGSMVCFGHYNGPRDEAAQADLKWIKSIRIQNRQVFGTAMLTQAVEEPLQRDNPSSLAYVRRMMPDADPLYTLDIAIWIAEDETSDERRRIRKAAERYCAELRAEKHQAFFHHDDTRGMSMVTIGLFDHRDLDHESGLTSERVNATMHQFPVRMVNGAEFNEPIDPARPSLGTRPQRPRLVLVP